MDFMVSAETDIGIVKNTNQDSLSVKIIDTYQGRMAFAIVCDGMGGLQKGEVASATVIKAFDKWVNEQLPILTRQTLDQSVIFSQWKDIISGQNEIIGRYGDSQGIKLGTTVVAMLITQSECYIINVGDSRAYIINDDINQITQDQTFIAREIALGHMTPEQAKTDRRRNVLLQCVGASEKVYPDVFYLKSDINTVYMLCSDGLRHEITQEEIYTKLKPELLISNDIMTQNSIILQNVSLSDIEALVSKVIDDKIKSINPTPTNVASKLLTRQETAKLLKISLPTLDNWTNAGLIKALFLL